MTKLSAVKIEISMLANEADMIARKVPAGPWATLARSAAHDVRYAKQRRTADKRLCDVRYYATRGAN